MTRCRKCNTPPSTIITVSLASLSSSNIMNMLLLTLAICCTIGLTRGSDGTKFSFSGQDTAVKGGRIQFIPCQSSGNGTSDIYWSRPDGARVGEDIENNIYATYENQQLLLVILEEKVGDEGEYICWEENSSGERMVREKFTVHVVEESPPVFEVSYELVEVYEGTIVALVCKADGDQPMTYKWLDQHGSEITALSRNSTMIISRSNHSELHLLYVSPNETSGVYTCLASNHLGTKSKLFQVVVNKTTGLFPPSFNVSIEVVYGAENESLTLKCQAEGRPAPTYSWYDDDFKELDKNHPLVIDLDDSSETKDAFNSSFVILVSKKEGSLTFPRLNGTDRNYTCKAQNLLGRAFKIYWIQVNSSSDGFPPFFNESRVEVVGSEYHSLTLICQAYGNPKPNIYWYNQYGEALSRYHQRVIDLDRLNDTSIIPNIKNSSILVSNRNGSIQFVQLRSYDAGHYTCYAQNSLGRASKTYRIYVKDSAGQFPPFFNESREEVFGLENESLTLTCQADGNPKPKYTWYNPYGEELSRYNQRVIDLDRLNDTSIFPNIKNSSILVSNSNGSITFVQLRRNDSGEYVCGAQNSLGRANKTYRIYINDSEVRDGNITVIVQNATDTSVTFNLIAPNSNVRGYEAQYKLIDARNVSTTNWSFGEEYTVSNLLQGAKYVFQFRTWSADIWTRPITVALKPGPPEIIIRQVSTGKVQMEFFRPFYLFNYKTIDRYIIKYRTVQQVGGNTWSYRGCEVTITLPSCYGNSYEISNLGSRVYYSITVQAAGPAGYSRPTEMKIYMP